MQYALWPSIPWEAVHGFYSTTELGTLSNRSSTVCVQQVNYCTTELETLFNRSRRTTVMLLLSIFYWVLGWEHHYSKDLTRRNLYVALTIWTTESGISFNRSSGTTFYVAVKTFCPPTLQKFETKTFLNVNIGGKTSKKLKSGSKMVCSCHLAEQQLLSGFDGYETVSTKEMMITPWSRDSIP